MAKDPAFLFYSADFLAGTQFLTHEQRGMYITLLCMQHQHGHLKEKHMLMICGAHDSDVYEKFMKDANGLYYQPRLEMEIEKRMAYTESRKKNRMKKDKETLPPKKKSVPIDATLAENEGTLNNMAPQIVFPFDSKNFVAVWQHWKDYKSREHAFEYASAQSEQAALKRLAKLSDGDEHMAAEIITASMANGWKGLFELKHDHKNGTGNNNTGENNKRVKRAIYDLVGDTTGCF